jgi:gas vesicle protein
MTDTDFRTDRQSPSQGLGDKLQQAGEEVKQRASDAFEATSDMAREKLDELGDAARETASHVTEKVKEQVSAQQDAGADYAQRFAENIRNAAKAFEQDTPIAARTIEMTAGYIEDAAEKIRNGSLNDVIDGVTSFARRQPAAFLGLSVLAGFAVVRFLKASGGSTSSAGTQSYPGSQTYGSSSRYGEFQSSGERRS